MAYTPINWQNGDTITAEKMNKMDNGWGVSTSGGELFSETVTTAIDPNYPDDPAWGDFTYSSFVTADSITITINGTDYVCARMSDGSSASFYGGWVEDGGEYIIDFSDYPFAFTSEEGYNAIATASDGTYTISVVASTITVETSSNFQMAVNSCVDTSTMPMECVSGATTYMEMATALGSGRILFFKPIQGNPIIKYITDFTQNNVSFMPETYGMSAAFDSDGVFTVSLT